MGCVPAIGRTALTSSRIRKLVNASTHQARNSPDGLSLDKSSTRDFRNRAHGRAIDLPALQNPPALKPAWRTLVRDDEGCIQQAAEDYSEPEPGARLGVWYHHVGDEPGPAQSAVDACKIAARPDPIRNARLLYRDRQEDRSWCHHSYCETVAHAQRSTFHLDDRCCRHGDCPPVLGRDSPQPLTFRAFWLHMRGN